MCKFFMKNDIINNNKRRVEDLKSLPLAECQFESGRGHQLFGESYNEKNYQ